MKELEEMGLSWGEAQAKAQGRVGWRNIIVVLCPRRDEEVEWEWVLKQTHEYPHGLVDLEPVLNHARGLFQHGHHRTCQITSIIESSKNINETDISIKQKDTWTTFHFPPLQNSVTTAMLESTRIQHINQSTNKEEINLCGQARVWVKFHSSSLLLIANRFVDTELL